MLQFNFFAWTFLYLVIGFVLSLAVVAIDMRRNRTLDRSRRLVIVLFSPLIWPLFLIVLPILLFGSVLFYVLNVFEEK